MNRAQSNEPDQLVSSTVSITVLSVTPARAKKLLTLRRPRLVLTSKFPRAMGMPSWPRLWRPLSS
jgi:hypothetical protein